MGFIVPFGNGWDIFIGQEMGYYGIIIIEASFTFFFKKGVKIYLRGYFGIPSVVKI